MPGSIIAVTGHGASSITQEAAATVAVPIPPMGRAPGIRSYTVQLLTFLCALRLGEIRQVLARGSGPVASAIAPCIRHGRKRLPQTMRLCAAGRRAGATRKTGYLWALVRATLLRCFVQRNSGRVAAWAQELEEWGHIQFFNRQVQTPTCLIVPPGRSVDCALELLLYVKGIGRYTIAVAHSEQPVWPTQIDLVLPVPQAVDEVFSPLVYCLAGELLAYYLAEIRDTPFFCADRPGFSSGRDRCVTAIHSVVSMTYVRCPPLTRDNTVLARNHYKRGIQLWNT